MLKENVFSAQLFVEQAPSALAIFDKEIRYMAASDQWLKDYELERFAIMEKSHYEVFPEISDEWKQIHQECLNGAVRSRNEDTLQKRDGSVQWISWEVRPWFIEEDKIGGIVMHSTDITSQKEKELLLLKYQDLLETTNEAALIGTWEVDMRSLTTHWSKVTKDIHEVDSGYEPNIENAIAFYKEGKSKDSIVEAFQTAIESGEKYDLELEIITARNKEKWVRAVGIPVMQNGKCIRVYGLFQDIDEKTKYIRQLAFQEEQFRQSFEFAANGKALVGLNGEWLRVNKSLCEMLGYSKEEFLEMTFKDITHPEDLVKDLSLLEELVNGKRESYQMEKRYFHKDGSLVWGLLGVSMVRGEHREPIHFISEINNITQRKTVEKEVRTLLDVTRDQNNRLLNFAHIVSHNLRSHSGNLSMIIDLMKMEIPSSTENDFFPLLLEASSNLKETIAHLNEVVVMNAKTEENLDSLNLLDFVENAIRGVKGLAVKANFTIENEVPSHAHVLAIPAYLESILLNLLTNAIKYRSTKRDSFVKISTQNNPPYTELIIEDNGLGIDMEKHGSKLFGMYKTFHGNKDARGIGLFITKNQIETMGGKIEVGSELNKGTTFKISFKNEEN